MGDVNTHGARAAGVEWAKASRPPDEIPAPLPTPPPWLPALVAGVVALVLILIVKKKRVTR
jgi:hypothetical protein